MYLCTLLLLGNRTAVQTGVISRFGNIKHHLVPERLGHTRERPKGHEYDEGREAHDIQGEAESMQA